jgi:hypothetical protein
MTLETLISDVSETTIKETVELFKNDQPFIHKFLLYLGKKISPTILEQYLGKETVINSYIKVVQELRKRGWIGEEKARVAERGPESTLHFVLPEKLEEFRAYLREEVVKKNFKTNKFLNANLNALLGNGLEILATTPRTNSGKWEDYRPMVREIYRLIPQDDLYYPWQIVRRFANNLYETVEVSRTEAARLNQAIAETAHIVQQDSELHQRINSLLDQSFDILLNAPKITEPVLIEYWEIIRELYWLISSEDKYYHGALLRKLINNLDEIIRILRTFKKQQESSQTELQGQKEELSPPLHRKVSPIERKLVSSPQLSGYRREARYRSIKDLLQPSGEELVASQGPGKDLHKNQRNFMKLSQPPYYIEGELLQLGARVRIDLRGIPGDISQLEIILTSSEEHVKTLKSLVEEQEVSLILEDIPKRIDKIQVQPVSD